MSGGDDRGSGEVSGSDGVVGGAEAKSAPIEEGVDGARHWPTVGADGGDHEDLHALETIDEVDSREARLRRVDSSQMRPGGGVARIQQSLQPLDVFRCLEHPLPPSPLARRAFYQQNRVSYTTFAR